MKEESECVPKGSVLTSSLSGGCSLCGLQALSQALCFLLSFRPLREVDLSPEYISLQMYAFPHIQLVSKAPVLTISKGLMPWSHLLLLDWTLLALATFCTQAFSKAWLGCLWESSIMSILETEKS